MVLDEPVAVDEDVVVREVCCAVRLGNRFRSINSFHFFDLRSNILRIRDGSRAFSLPDCHARDGGGVLWRVREQDALVRRAGAGPVYAEFLQEEEVHVFWEFISFRVEEAAEETFVSESGGEDFAGWEEVLVGCVADGHLLSCVPLIV